MVNKLALRLSAVALLVVPFGTARADLVLSSLTLQTGQGFGATTTIITMANGNTGNENGCFAYGGATSGGYKGVKGVYTASDANYSGTGVNVGNLCIEGDPETDVTNPAHFPKNQILDLNALGFT